MYEKKLVVLGVLVISLLFIWIGKISALQIDVSKINYNFKQDGTNIHRHGEINHFNDTIDSINNSNTGSNDSTNVSNPSTNDSNIILIFLISIITFLILLFSCKRLKYAENCSLNFGRNFSSKYKGILYKK